ncbi:hypothetical protein M011DRAFT_459645 [Sporormia fimetaria CBS 119925]|uniref:NAP family protein n=1 Tax=Sporormia fimetaria CBS 119925 TaxID=1340428 RepID=A0A6A6V9C8_9PLEO|nr:hypothetical protein M011DRAFT_459645 [Sporormia fimetaria CBS 119925]
MTDHSSEEVLARFEELTALEAEFEDVELQTIRKANELNEPLYKKRAEIIAKIPHFWALVFEQSPTELDSYILPSDSKVFADCLQSLEITRFEIDDPKGDPRSFSMKFTFSDNEYFKDEVLEKFFWYRKSLDGWQGLVSEPVKVNWKKDHDLTYGLTDAAYKLYEARKKLPKGANETELKEYKSLAEKIENSEDPQLSFFAWFAYVSSYKFVTAEESQQAAKKLAEELEKRKKGEKVDEEEPEDDDEQDYQETEVFPMGDQVATIITEDMWPSAIKYYKLAHEAEDDDEHLSEIEFDDLDDESDGEIDIRALVGKGKKNKASGDLPPAKKPRKA